MSRTPACFSFGHIGQCYKQPCLDYGPWIKLQGLNVSNSKFLLTHAPKLSSWVIITYDSSKEQPPTRLQTSNFLPLFYGPCYFYWNTTRSHWLNNLGTFDNKGILLDFHLCIGFFFFFVFLGRISILTFNVIKCGLGRHLHSAHLRKWKWKSIKLSNGSFNLHLSNPHVRTQLWFRKPKYKNSGIWVNSSTQQAFPPQVFELAKTQQVVVCRPSINVSIFPFWISNNQSHPLTQMLTH